MEKTPLPRSTEASLRALRRAALAWSVLGAVALCACGEVTTATGTVFVPCNSNGDCKAGDVCLFSTYASCTSTGVCTPIPDGQACLPMVACVCGGSTGTVCLVNGNSPAPIESLGSCDGATQQQPFDAGTPAKSDDAGTIADAGSDTSTSAIPDATTSDDMDAGFDAGQVNTLGTKCTSSQQCTDPNYNQCADPTTGSTSCRFSSSNCICTAGCTSDQDCQPPSNGSCAFGSGIGICQLQ